MNITLELARFLAGSRLDAIDEPVQHESVRALINWLGCALGGSLEPAVDTAMEGLAVDTPDLLAKVAEMDSLLVEGWRRVWTGPGEEG